MLLRSHILLKRNVLLKIKTLLGLSAVLVLAGCSSSNTLSSAGEQVKFSDTQPGSECQLVGQVTGTQSNWLSGQAGKAAQCVVQQMTCVIKQQQWVATSSMAQPARVKPSYQALHH